MKKETIEKLFRRYIGIYDDVVFRTTGEHISENEINTVNTQVEQLFKEYEHIETLTDFTQFTKKIQEILTNTTESASKLNKEQLEKTLNETYWKFNNDPFGFIQKEIDETISKIIPDTYGDYYIPDNPYLDIAASKGYNTPFRLDKIQEHIKEIDPKWKNEQLRAEEINNTEYKNKLESILLDINKIPLQFCIETITKYFDKELLLSLLFVKNDTKNKIIKYAISLPTFDKNLLVEKFKLFDDNELIKLPKILFEENAKYFIENFIKTIPSREKILNYHFELWEEYIKNFNKKQQKELKKKIQIIKTYKDNLSDASVIRFQNVTNLLNVNANYNNIKTEITLLINELETLKFKNGELNTYTEKYSNIINELFNTVKITELTQPTRDMVFYAIKPKVDEFNKQYKYKYQWLYAKSLLKKIIKIK